MSLWVEQHPSLDFRATIFRFMQMAVTITYICVWLDAKVDAADVKSTLHCGAVAQHHCGELPVPGRILWQTPSQV